MTDTKPLGAAAAEDEDDLVRLARGGDRRAFDRLVTTHMKPVWATVWRIVRDRSDTEDVVQETFVTAYRSLRGFRGDAKFSTWLHRIAVTRALNHRERSEEKLRRASDPIEVAAERAAGTGASPLHALESKELMRRLAACLELLPAAWRAVLALREAEDLDYQRIAEILGLELGTVRSRLSRARASLKACVEGGPA